MLILMYVQYYSFVAAISTDFLLKSDDGIEYSAKATHIKEKLIR